MSATSTMIIDAGLRGLAALLDPDRLSSVLERAGVRLARRSHLRYKPGTSCLAGIVLDDGVAFGYAVADSAGPKLDKIIRKTDPAAVLVHDRDRNLIIARARADRDLPALADPHAALAAIRPGPSATLRTLAYKPQRRWVGLASRAGEPPLLLRAYRPATVADAHRRLTWYEHLTGGRRIVGWQPRSGVIATSFQPGASLADLIDHGTATDTNLHDTGVALARLHDHPPLSGPTVRQADPAATVALIGVLLPEQSARAERILARLRATAPAAVAPQPCHGDFSADQVIIHNHHADLSEMSSPMTQLGSDKSVGLIDFDRSGLGDPAADLAGLPAAGLGPAAFDRVLAGYRTVRPMPAGLDWHLAHALLLRAAEPFRSGAADWAAAIPERLTRIEEALS
ncbi:aminoglycoside phosphotransferase family protein [Microlunatus speluncae]|uniref:aminoglycoside phosphotransferase family protein n=1 Tax=Microlunatus speluncae TaxID=2594267 RepID=UPI0012663FC5|nr:aminoglycoside phosphotransferase family protein [Microlunatus speluncae]